MADSTYIKDCVDCEGAGTNKPQSLSQGSTFGRRVIGTIPSNETCLPCKGTGKILTEEGEEIAEVIKHLKKVGAI